MNVTVTKAILETENFSVKTKMSVNCTKMTAQMTAFALILSVPLLALVNLALREMDMTVLILMSVKLALQSAETTPLVKIMREATTVLAMTDFLIMRALVKMSMSV